MPGIFDFKNFKNYVYLKFIGIIGVLASAIVLLCYKDGSYPERQINFKLIKRL